MLLRLCDSGEAVLAIIAESLGLRFAHRVIQRERLATFAEVTTRVGDREAIYAGISVIGSPCSAFRASMQRFSLRGWRDPILSLIDNSSRLARLPGASRIDTHLPGPQMQP